MNLRDLRYLVVLADTRHFGKAAEKCCVSQPTLSAQIRKLEDYLGVTLVERKPRNVTLTEVGEQIVARARSALRDSDEIVAIAKLSHDPLAGTLRMALIPTLAPYLLPRVAPRIHKAVPKLQLLLFEYQTATLLERLRDGDIDLGILALPVDAEGLESQELFDEPFMVALPKDHPLAKRASLKVEDLRDEKLLLLEDGHCLRDQALSVCGHVGIKEPQDFRATSLETLRQMVGAGLGITLLPALATTGPFAETRNLAIKPFARPVPRRTIGAVWRKSSTRRAVIDVVCQVIRKAGPVA
jgi:LysR family hydrogen peroxide-inducible transcriptional activator